MTELIRERLFETVELTTEPHPQHRAGLVFVPCALCRAPLDLSLLGDNGVPRLCDHHLVFDGLPLQ